MKDSFAYYRINVRRGFEYSFKLKKNKHKNKNGIENEQNGVLTSRINH